MNEKNLINDLVVRFANVNGTGSASANNLFARAIYKMGVPVSPKNIFPSNIQGLPTWYEVRVSEKGYLGRKEGIDIMVAVNAQSFDADVASVKSGGYLIYDSTKMLAEEDKRPDIHYIGIPMMKICLQHYSDARTHLLMKNVIYIGALAALLDMEIDVFEALIQDQFKKKEKLIPGNIQALHLGVDFAKQLDCCPLPYQIKRADLIGDRILMEGNNACGLGALFAGATFGSWYPITPSTSVMNAFEKWCYRFRVDPDSGEHKFAIVQSEDELAAIGMVLGASWNGARAFTATSGPGLSLMSEFLGLAYFAEIPAVLVDVQRGGPSTGMPTRTQQSDLLSAAYASHGDTKHLLLFPASPKECFDMTADAFDFAERYQTPVIIMTDLDLGMNDHLTDPPVWDDARVYDRGKVLSAQDLDHMEKFGRYLDVDGDGVPYRTIPGVHPNKGSYFTRGSSKDEYARYTEDNHAYQRNVDRLQKKWETIRENTYHPEIAIHSDSSKLGMIYFGTSSYAAEEAIDLLRSKSIVMNEMRLKAFPFGSEVKDFIDQCDLVYVVEQNRDGQCRSLLINDLNINPSKLTSVLNYDGFPITAKLISELILQNIEKTESVLS